MILFNDCFPDLDSDQWFCNFNLCSFLFERPNKGLDLMFAHMWHIEKNLFAFFNHDSRKILDARKKIGWSKNTYREEASSKGALCRGDLRFCLSVDAPRRTEEGTKTKRQHMRLCKEEEARDFGEVSVTLVEENLKGWFGTNLQNEGWISADRGTKATLMRTIPRSLFKSSTKDLSLPIFELVFSIVCARILCLHSAVAMLWSWTPEGLYLLMITSGKAAYRRFPAWILA